MPCPHQPDRSGACPACAGERTAAAFPPKRTYPSFPPGPHKCVAIHFQRCHICGYEIGKEIGTDAEEPSARSAP